MVQKRYFIVFYAGTNALTKKAVFGNMSAVTEAKHYINQSETVDFLINKLHLINPVITGIIEVNKTDFDDFNKKPEPQIKK